MCIMKYVSEDFIEPGRPHTRTTNPFGIPPSICSSRLYTYDRMRGTVATDSTFSRTISGALLHDRDEALVEPVRDRRSRDHAAHRLDLLDEPQVFVPAHRVPHAELRLLLLERGLREVPEQGAHGLDEPDLELWAHPLPP